MTDVDRAAPVRARSAGRLAYIAAVPAALLLTNLIVSAIGRALGGNFPYTQNGASVRVEAVAITFLSLGPLATGLLVVGLLARRWPVALRVARVAAPVLAVATIFVITIPAGFDTTSAVCLAAMH